MIGSLTQNEFLRLQRAIGKNSKEISEICEVSQAAVKRWRDGEAKCSGEHARKLLELCPDFFKDKIEFVGKVKIEIDFTDLVIKAEPSQIDLEDSNMADYKNIGVNIVAIGFNKNN